MTLPTYATRAWADGVFDLREALVLLRKKWAAITDPNTPCPIEFSVEEMKEHERQSKNFRCYEAAIDGIYSALLCEEMDGSPMRTTMLCGNLSAASRGHGMRT
jgi:hypothetical protein